MPDPLPHDHPDAYDPRRIGREIDDGETDRRDPATVRREARAERLEEGLPVDDATLDRVVEAVLDPDYPLPGLHLTFEEAGDDVPEEAEERVDAFLEAYPELDAGVREGWHEGRRALFVAVAGTEADVARAADVLRHDRVVVERGRRPVAELQAVADRIFADEDALAREGFRIMGGGVDPAAGVADIEVVAPSGREAAQAHLARRYGPAVRVAWLGPAMEREAPLPFGSYRAEGRSLRVFFAIDHNGERFARAGIAEQSSERVVIAVTCWEPVGATTLIGGFQPLHADLDLDAPLGSRPVVDGATGEVRPQAPGA